MAVPWTEYANDNKSGLRVCPMWLNLKNLREPPELYPEPRNDIPSRVEVGIHASSLQHSTFRVFVILADENDGELPKCRHVHGLSNLPLSKGRRSRGQGLMEKTRRSVCTCTWLTAPSP